MRCLEGDAQVRLPLPKAPGTGGGGSGQILCQELGFHSHFLEEFGFISSTGRMSVFILIAANFLIHSDPYQQMLLLWEGWMIPRKMKNVYTASCVSLTFSLLLCSFLSPPSCSLDASHCKQGHLIFSWPHSPFST